MGGGKPPLVLGVGEKQRFSLFVVPVAPFLGAASQKQARKAQGREGRTLQPARTKGI